MLTSIQTQKLCKTGIFRELIKASHKFPNFIFYTLDTQIKVSLKRIKSLSPQPYSTIIIVSMSKLPQRTGN